MNKIEVFDRSCIIKPTKYRSFKNKAQTYFYTAKIYVSLFRNIREHINKFKDIKSETYRNLVYQRGINPNDPQILSRIDEKQLKYSQQLAHELFQKTIPNRFWNNIVQPDVASYFKQVKDANDEITILSYMGKDTGKETLSLAFENTGLQDLIEHYCNFDNVDRHNENLYSSLFNMCSGRISRFFSGDKKILSTAIGGAMNCDAEVRPDMYFVDRYRAKRVDRNVRFGSKKISSLDELR